MALTKKFWGGLLTGIGGGMFVGGMIAQPEEPLPQAAICTVVKHPSSIVAPGVALVITGMVLARDWARAIPGPPAQ